MKVILNQDIPRVGKKYEVKNVPAGYARNFLIPRRLAVAATPDAEVRARGHQIRHEAEEQKRLAHMMQSVESLRDTVVPLTARANEQGHLFAGLDREDVAAAVMAHSHVELPDYVIELPKPIKESGEHKVVMKVGDRTIAFTLVVAPEGART